MAAIELKGIKKIYEDGTEAVRGVDLSIKNGEFLVLLGPTGCGKTTLLRMIAGLDPVTEGAILFDGKDVTDLPPKKRNTAMVFQNYSLYPDRNIYRNIAFPLENLSMKEEEIDRRVRDAAKRLGITDILNEKPRSLSGGQKQRAALARALVREPSVFLLDEPFSNLDAEMRESLRDDLLEIHESLGTTFLYVTHDQREAMETGSRIAVMDHGRIVEEGEPAQIWTNPSHSGEGDHFPGRALFENARARQQTSCRDPAGGIFRNRKWRRNCSRSDSRPPAGSEMRDGVHSRRDGIYGASCRTDPERRGNARPQDAGGYDPPFRSRNGHADHEVL